MAEQKPHTGSHREAWAARVAAAAVAAAETALAPVSGAAVELFGMFVVRCVPGVSYNSVKGTRALPGCLLLPSTPHK